MRHVVICSLHTSDETHHRHQTFIGCLQPCAFVRVARLQDTSVPAILSILMCKLTWYNCRGPNANLASTQTRAVPVPRGVSGGPYGGHNDTTQVQSGSTNDRRVASASRQSSNSKPKKNNKKKSTTAAAVLATNVQVASSSGSHEPTTRVSHPRHSYPDDVSSAISQPSVADVIAASIPKWQFFILPLTVSSKYSFPSLK